jgi:hypothetical protein
MDDITVNTVHGPGNTCLVFSRDGRCLSESSYLFHCLIFIISVNATLVVLMVWYASGVWGKEDRKNQNQLRLMGP